MGVWQRLSELWRGGIWLLLIAGSFTLGVRATAAPAALAPIPVVSPARMPAPSTSIPVTITCAAIAPRLQIGLVCVETAPSADVRLSLWYCAPSMAAGAALLRDPGALPGATALAHWSMKADANGHAILRGVPPALACPSQPQTAPLLAVVALVRVEATLDAASGLAGMVVGVE